MGLHLTVERYRWYKRMFMGMHLTIQRYMRYDQVLNDCT